MHRSLRLTLVLSSLVGIVPLACGSSGDPAATLAAGAIDAGPTTTETKDASTAAVDATVEPVIDAGTDAGPLVTPIKHVVVIVKENHTFDNFFGTFPGAEGTTVCHSKDQGDFPCPHAVDRPHDLCHSHKCALADYNGGALDGFDDSKGDYDDNQAYAQYHEADLPNYWAYARHFGLGDHFFANELGPSFPGHLFLLAAQAGWAVGNPPVDIGGFPPKLHPFWGCDETPGDTLQVLDNASCKLVDKFPCFDIPAVPDILPQGTSWKFYGSNFYLLGEIWSMFDAVEDIRNGPRWDNIVNADDFMTDIDNGTLPDVSWLVNQDLNSEHPGLNISMCKGENWTVTRINKLMQSEYWKDTVILMTFDDFGGWYDHVKPPRQYGCDANQPYGLGFRLPLLIISPYVKPGSIFSEVAEQASIPHFIGKIFHATKTLTDLDPAAQDKQANDLLNAFDFQQTPLAPLVLQTRTCP
jgi:phospholipase C